MLYLASLGSSQTAIRTGWYFCTVVLHHPGRSSVCRLVFQLIQHLIQIIKDLGLMRLIDQTLSAGQEQKPACPAGLQYTLRVNGGTLPLLSPYITHHAYGTMDWTLRTCWEQIVSDTRHLSDLQWFWREYPSQSRCVRVEASEETRRERDWEFTTGIDDAV